MPHSSATTDDLALLVPVPELALMKIRYALGRPVSESELAAHILNTAYEAKKREKESK